MNRFFPAVILTLAFCFPSAFGKNKTDATNRGAEICDRFEPQVQKLADGKEYLNAIKALADYEQTLLKLYPEPVFDHGVYQNPGEHMSIRSGFEGWTEQPKENLRVPAWLSVIGFETLLALEGAGDDQKFVVLSIDKARVERRFGQDRRRPNAVTDDELTQIFRLAAGNLGVIQTQDFKTIAGRRMLIGELRGRNGSPIIIAVAGANGRMYRFNLWTAEAKEVEDKKKFFKTLENVRFDFKPANAEKIQRVQRVASQNIRESLAQVRELVAIGEYNTAVEELSHVRMLLGDEMPGPEIHDNVAKHPLYGISLKNPDPQKWRLSATNKAGVGMLILEDRLSMTPIGVMILVVNTTMMFGPDFVQAVIDKGNEYVKREMLAGAGRGSLGTVSTKVESESFQLFRGALAYQATAISKTPNSKVRQILTANSDYLLTIVEMGSDRDFEAKCKEFDEIIDKNLDLGTNESGAVSK